MKQRRIKELTINHYEQGASVTYTPSRTEEYAPVLAQAEAHQDLRFRAEINSEEVLIILPWESVIGVYATYETADVAATTDTICGGGEVGTLELTPTTFGNKSITYFPTEGILPCSFSIFDVPTYFDGLIYNGNEVDIYTAKADPSFSYTVKDGVYNSEYASWYIPHECGDTSIHAGDKKDVEFTVKYKGATATAVVECTITVSQ